MGRWHQTVRIATGSKFNRLTVLGPSVHTGKYLRSICACECGRLTSIRDVGIKAGHVKSCGCLHLETVRKLNTKAPGVAARNRLWYWYSKRDKQFALTKADFFWLIAQPCHYCGCAPSKLFETAGGSIRWNGIDRLSSEWGYTPTNCVPCCFTCNRIKTVLPYPVFIQQIKQIYEHLKLGRKPQ